MYVGISFKLKSPALFRAKISAGIFVGKFHKIEKLFWGKHYTYSNSVVFLYFLPKISADTPGIDVMITIIGDFCQFSSKKLVFFSKTNVMIIKKTSSSWSKKCQFFFAKKFGENIFKIITSVSGRTPCPSGWRSETGNGMGACQAEELAASGPRHPRGLPDGRHRGQADRPAALPQVLHHLCPGNRVTFRKSILYS
jgi:hypothetical protein